MARDRKRAKQRERRRGARPDPGLPESKPRRADLPGSLDHASGETDEFDAALVRGAQGALGGDGQPPAAEQKPEGSSAATGPAGASVALEGARAAAERSAAPSRPLPERAVDFLQASWAELQRVQWPDRSQVFQATAVVIGFVFIASIYLGIADWVAQKIVNLII